MKLNKEQIKILIKCVEKEIDSYDYHMIKDFPSQYSKLQILLSDLKKEKNAN